MSRIIKTKKETEELTLAMQKFCLDPSFDTFAKICACKRLRTMEGYDFEIWRLAVLYVWGHTWETKYGQDAVIVASGGYSQDYLGEFERAEAKLCERTLKNPTKSSLTAVWHMYFATGEFKYLEVAYQVAGYPNKHKEYASDVYAKIRDTYSEEVNELIKKDPNHFRGREDHYNFVNFGNHVKKIVEKGKTDPLIVG